MTNEFYVYAWKISKTNETFYIGKGKGKRMFYIHQRNNRFKVVYENNECNVILLANNLTEQEAFAFEIEAIRNYRSIGQAKCNISNGGEGPTGLKHTEESKRKISIAKTGIHHTEETKKRISKNTKGNKNSLGTKNHLWHKHSEETKKKMSLLRKGTNQSEETKEKQRIPVDQYDLNGNFIKRHKGINEVKRVYGYHTGNIIDCCKGKRKTANNCLWRYA